MTSFISSFYLRFPLSVTAILYALYTSISEDSYCFDTNFYILCFVSFPDFTLIFTLCFPYLFENIVCLSVWMTYRLAHQTHFCHPHLSYCIFLRLCLAWYLLFNTKQNKIEGVLCAQAVHNLSFHTELWKFFFQREETTIFLKQETDDHVKRIKQKLK